jgi:hypothetical protein
MAVLTFVGALLAASASAQSWRIDGKVTDGQDRPVAAASISVEVISISAPDIGFVARRNDPDQKQQTKTNERGEYVVHVPTPGVYLVTASKPGVGLDKVKIAVGNAATANLRLSFTGRRTMSVCTKSTSDLPRQQHPLAVGGDPALARLVLWLDAVTLHAAGCADQAAIEVGRWTRGHLETVLRDLRELSRFWSRFQESVDRDRLIVVLYERRFTGDEIDRIFHFRGNETLRRGAVLHADIAEFVDGDLTEAPLVEDGERKGWRSGTLHWEAGRQLLDIVKPGPAGDKGSLLWYRAVSAHLLREGRLAEVKAHLDKARQVFPEQPNFLLDSAYLHQELSSPSIQAAVQDLRDEGTNVAVSSRRDELRRAESFLRQTLALAPDDDAARVRLGHTLGELRRHEAAIAELRKVTAAASEQQRYFAELFLGREAQALGRRDAARRHFESAAALYPNAQSPRLALAYLARQSSNRETAIRLLQEVTGRPASDTDRIDPWWSYYEPHLDDATDLMEAMRRLD